eukprot:Phypoly_transcript_11546.p1 GENE.Phypoly_transcript_11546~~Phypoly_transcript_11546.p1  ORF type:complete len:260 (+),score=6.03 Phypoly_transcript_11546:52-780(+)
MDLNATLSPVWLTLGAVVWILLSLQTAKHFRHYLQKKSPLALCYIFCIIALLTFEVYHMLTIAKVTSAPSSLVIFVSVTSLFSAYLIVLYSWVVVYLKLRMIYKEWKKICIWALISCNVVAYGLVIGFVAVDNTFFATCTLLATTSFLSFAYLVAIITTYRLSHNSIFQKEKLQKMTKMANGACTITFLELVCDTIFLQFKVRMPKSLGSWATYECIQVTCYQNIYCDLYRTIYLFTRILNW